jgi:hypothetical protein
VSGCAQMLATSVHGGQYRGHNPRNEVLPGRQRLGNGISGGRCVRYVRRAIGVSRNRDIPMMPRRPPPYTSGIFSLVKASPTACAATVKIVWLPGDDPQLYLISRRASCCVAQRGRSQDAYWLAKARLLGEGCGRAHCAGSGWRGESQVTQRDGKRFYRAPTHQSSRSFPVGPATALIDAATFSEFWRYKRWWGKPSVVACTVMSHSMCIWCVAFSRPVDHRSV